MRYVSRNDHPPLLVIAGPTAVGKTEIAIKLAQAFDGEIISADSRQVYRYMDIGTAKPTLDEQKTVQHHLIDILDPDEELSLAQYQMRAYDTIVSIGQRGYLPMLVGGTGQYVRSVVEGWRVPQVPPQPAIRADLEAFAETYGATALHARLAVFDSEAAVSIDWRNVRRVVRAIEVCIVSGTSISTLKQRSRPPYQILIIGLTRSREELYRRVDERIEKMVQAGLIAETEGLLERGYSFRLPSMSSLGYPEVGAYLRNEISLEEMLVAIRASTRSFIRHQYNWFQLGDPMIHWFDLTHESHSSIVNLGREWLR